MLNTKPRYVVAAELWNQGFSLQEIASRMGISENTVKSHVHARNRKCNSPTQREMQVGQLKANGIGNREIGRTLGLSEKTVGAHVASLYRKLKINNAVQLSLLINDPTWNWQVPKTFIPHIRRVMDVSSSNSRISPEQRFWGKVERGDFCWNWNGVLNKHGYGIIKFRGRQKFAHRLAWELERGEIPKNKQLHHVCQNPRCVRVSHLMALTPYEHRSVHPRTPRRWMVGQ